MRAKILMVILILIFSWQTSVCLAQTTVLYRENEILIFDEPTAVLTHGETKELMKTMKSFRNEGKTILFITHKLEEIMEVSDRVTVMRKGQHIGTVETKNVNKNILSEMMVGRPVEMTLKKDKAKPGKTVLSVKNLTVAFLHSVRR